MREPATCVAETETSADHLIHNETARHWAGVKPEERRITEFGGTLGTVQELKLELSWGVVCD